MTFEKTEATLKWFDVKKGYGFFTTEDGDVFVHPSLLKGSGVSGTDLWEAAQDNLPAVISYVEKSDGRLQIAQLHRLGDREVAKEMAAKRPKTVKRQRKQPIITLKCGDRSTGRLKRFDHQRGFGFLEVVDRQEHPDVFVHISTVPDNLIQYLDEGTVFDFAVGETQRGINANILQLHEEQMVAE